MPKKDTHSAVLGMLSAAGEQTRVVTEEPASESRASTAKPTTPVAERPTDVSRPVTTLSRPAAQPVAAEPAPRTMRLREGAASGLRAAWLEAKRDDVLLTAQDFASDLVEEALRRRSRAARSS